MTSVVLPNWQRQQKGDADARSIQAVRTRCLHAIATLSDIVLVLLLKETLVYVILSRQR